MISGSLVALVTPMLPNGELDWQRLHDLVEFHIEKGTDGIVAVGTTGESATVTVEEHCQILKRVIDQVNGRIPVIAGTGANSTQEAVHLTAEARALGADACLLVTPYYNKPTQEGLYRHFEAIAASVAIPQILYNVPGRTSVDLLNETVERLAGLDNIIAIKDATGDLKRGRDLIQRCSDRIAVISGDDETAVELMLMGGKGDISVTANVVPAEMHQLCALAIDGQAEEARALNERLMPLHKNLFAESNPIPVKFALQEMRLIDSGIRLPLTPLSPACHKQVRDALSSCGIKV
ncbi:4-hydroxy-tetrahydrodipicolinate synthase [Sansalvadorimonas sp. 2012CJ34-2]|uniref:4-hydroxy-tetrahydrodipicolinate synthase n=1 Tax=Parendozoicomonas callyspongiae TaxID=2942213 RepID=A0ABT0PKM0_9GAMM|nr:4-hydroxy-tetrahydrodipicolinate synthase [Sansalvadorimonas sp. 2012CJ34-2]MCL6271526.1 4-hydroxy-tetrahydrodipicolinate synthase [Sansalvadorimonas sp. 2012CJ34-2]